MNDNGLWRHTIMVVISTRPIHVVIWGPMTVWRAAGNKLFSKRQLLSRTISCNVIITSYTRNKSSCKLLRSQLRHSLNILFNKILILFLESWAPELAIVTVAGKFVYTGCPINLNELIKDTAIPSCFISFGFELFLQLEQMHLGLKLQSFLVPSTNNNEFESKFNNLSTQDVCLKFCSKVFVA